MIHCFALDSFGADHDGEAKGNVESCTDKTFIMGTDTIVFTESTPYSDNPWRFSSCSIAAFKAHYQTLKNNNKYELSSLLKKILNLFFLILLMHV